MPLLKEAIRAPRLWRFDSVNRFRVMYSEATSRIDHRNPLTVKAWEKAVELLDHENDRIMKRRVFKVACRASVWRDRGEGGSSHIRNNMKPTVKKMTIKRIVAKQRKPFFPAFRMFRHIFSEVTVENKSNKKQSYI